MTTTRWIKFQAPAELALVATPGYGAPPERIRAAERVPAARIQLSQILVLAPFPRRDARDGNMCAHPRDCEYARTTTSRINFAVPSAIPPAGRRVCTRHSQIRTYIHSLIELIAADYFPSRRIFR